MPLNSLKLRLKTHGPKEMTVCLYFGSQPATKTFMSFVRESIPLSEKLVPGCSPPLGHKSSLSNAKIQIWGEEWDGNQNPIADNRREELFVNCIENRIR